MVSQPPPTEFSLLCTLRLWERPAERGSRVGVWCGPNGACAAHLGPQIACMQTGLGENCLVHIKGLALVARKLRLCHCKLCNYILTVIPLEWILKFFISCFILFKTALKFFIGNNVLGHCSALVVSKQKPTIFFICFHMLHFLGSINPEVTMTTRHSLAHYIWALWL